MYMATMVLVDLDDALLHHHHSRRRDNSAVAAVVVVVGGVPMVMASSAIERSIDKKVKRKSGHSGRPPFLHSLVGYLTSRPL
jgi:hypothetical protein